VRHSSYAFISILFLLVSTILAPRIVSAEPLDSQKSDQPTGEVFTGGTLSGNSWISWAGVVKSLSSGLYDEGWRLRAFGAYGQYGFISGDQSNSATPTLFEIMPGYQFKTGPLISKLYMGLHGEHHKFKRPDPGNKIAGMGYGFKVISENWIDLPMNSFASLDGSFSTLNTSYMGMLRVGTAKYVDRLFLGPEVQIIGNEENYYFHFGGFARWKMKDSQIEGSAGFAKDFDKKNTPYFSISWLKKF
jgi:Cellulose biosynthesis protein BcsS